MALDTRNLDPGGSSKGTIGQARYHTTDDISTIEGANYFDLAAGMMHNGGGGGSILVKASDAMIQYGYASTVSSVTLDTGNKNTLD